MDRRPAVGVPARAPGRRTARTVHRAARRARVLVDAVRLPDLDLLQAGGRQRLLELAPGECAGDAAGELPYVVAGRLVHLLVGDHVADGEASTWLEHPRSLADDLRLV